MATTKEIKRRISSISNTKKITKAMELVSASKMRKALEKTLASREYAKYAWEILKSLSYRSKETKIPLLKIRSVKKVLVLAISSNKGLCGGFNSQVFKKVIHEIRNPEKLMVNRILEEKIEPQITKEELVLDFVAVGKKVEHALGKMGVNIIASFTELPDNIEFADSLSISKILLNSYAEEKYDKVVVVYTDYISALTQTAKIRQILPISITDLEKVIDELDHKEKEELKRDDVDYIYEPQFDKMVTSMTEKLSQMQIYQMLLESKASEESSRMMAMKNASEAAQDMIEDLTLVFNKARQSGITQEISEISAGMTSLE